MALSPQVEINRSPFYWGAGLSILWHSWVLVMGKWWWPFLFPLDSDIAGERLEGTGHLKELGSSKGRLRVSGNNLVNTTERTFVQTYFISTGLHAPLGLGSTVKAKSLCLWGRQGLWKQCPPMNTMAPNSTSYGNNHHLLRTYHSSASRLTNNFCVLPHWILLQPAWIPLAPFYR